VAKVQNETFMMQSRMVPRGRASYRRKGEKKDGDDGDPYKEGPFQAFQDLGFGLKVPSIRERIRGDIAKGGGGSKARA